MLEKTLVIQKCITTYEEKIHEIEQSLGKTREGAIDAVGSMTSWSDTTKFQLSNLALGIQRRLGEAKLTAVQLRQLSPISNPDSPICEGSLFTLRNPDTGKNVTVR